MVKGAYIGDKYTSATVVHNMVILTNIDSMRVWQYHARVAIPLFDYDDFYWAITNTRAGLEHGNEWQASVYRAS